MIDSRERFSERVEDYVRFRPGYPPELITALLEGLGDPRSLNAADIGSGTGIFTRLLLERGVAVSGVEPNAGMRRAAEGALHSSENFTSVAGSAEDSGLADASIDLLTAAQAFHWFPNARTRTEFARILKPGGRLALIWNRRRVREPFQRAYEALLREFAPEYGKVNHLALTDDEIAAFFEPGKMALSTFDNRQQLDFESLLGRLRSSSYCPAPDSSGYRELKSALEELFARHAIDGTVRFVYDSHLYRGPVAR
jgi:ubiquinone/menaquinone biosynthesis C-methylase UbiE